MIIKVISFHAVVGLVFFQFYSDCLGSNHKISLILNNLLWFFFLTGNMNENPWQVESVQAFAFLNCPECTFKTREETFFQVKNFVTIFCFASTLVLLIYGQYGQSQSE